MNFLRFWFPVMAYSGIIFWVSGQPNLRAPASILYADKIAHILEYIPLGILAVRAFIKTSYRYFYKYFLYVFAVVFTLLYGLSDEYHQSFVPGRSSSLWDCLADTIGGTIGVGLYILIQRMSNK